MRKKLEKRLRQRAASLGRGIRNAGESGRKKSKLKKRVAVAGVAIAGAAGIAAAAAHYLRNDRGSATFHVLEGGDGWSVKADGHDKPMASYPTKKEAVAAGRKAAGKAAPSQLLIHRADGSVAASHGYGSA